MRAALYLRVSTDEQATKGNSLPEQKERLEAYCKAMGWDEYDIFIDDGYSAKNMDRPKLQEMLEEIRENKYQAIVTTKIDRLCRNLLDLLMLIDELETYRCSYVSSSESFDTSTPAGRMVLQILGAFAEFERERIRERVKDNMKSLAKKINKPISRPCFGYDIIDGKYVINEFEAEQVRRMAVWALQGEGAYKIAKKLNQEGVKTKDSKSFSEGAVRKLLHRETLMGTFVYNRKYIHKKKTLIRPQEEWIITEDHHDPILTKVEFEELQLALASRSVGRKQANNERWILSGLIECKHCGSKMSGNSRNKGSKEYLFYLCSSYHKKGECFRHYIYRDEIEAMVIKYLLSMNENQLSGNLNALQNQDNEIDINTVEMLKSKLEKINRKMQRQIELYEDEEISREDFRVAKKRIELERERVESEIKSAEKNLNLEAKNKFIDRLSKLRGDLLSDDRLSIKNAIRQLIDKVEITNGETVNAVIKI